MKKSFSILVFIFCIYFTHAQELPDVAESRQIEAQLDKLPSSFYPKPLSDTLFDSLRLNKYNFKPGQVPYYPDSVYAQRLRDLGSAIPFAYNQYVQSYINLYVNKRREQMQRMLGLQHIYFPIFEAELDRQGMPMELKYLPVVESALNPHARSRAGATGLWQFMLPTGRMYGLHVTSYIDERSDPYKATKAAVQYLKDMYESYGDWLLVIAAYNCGPGNVNKAIVRSGGKADFWLIRDYLPRETRGYVPAFIAANYAFQYATEHNLYPIRFDFSFAQDTIHVHRQNISLQQLATVTGTEYYILKDLNPELKVNEIPYTAKPYILRIPHQAGELFAARRDSLLQAAANHHADTLLASLDKQKVSPITRTTYVESLQQKAKELSYRGGNGKLIYHTVRSGEVVSTIAEKYGVSWKQIASWNGLRNYRIKPGMKLKIYSSKSASKPGKTTYAQAKPSPPANANASYYTVQSGDTLWDIAQKFDGVTIESIKTLNGMRSSRLKIGQQLRIR